MDKFFLEKPSINRKEEIIEFLNEFVKYHSNINGSGGLDKIYDGYTFEQALERTLNMENEDYAKKNHRCPGKTFLLIRNSDNKIIGTINIRWNLTKEMQQFGGNIGFGIRPTERRKGYNKINLYLGLLETQKLGLKKIMLDCEANNIGSEKTMQALGGILIRQEVNPKNGILTNTYCFNVDECIKKYKPIYGNLIMS